MKMVLSLLLSLLVSFSFISCSFAECVIKMTYKDNEKLPLIAKQPDNSGVYFDLFSKAADKIDCKIEIVRTSKGRLHKQLETGELDFYPGTSFSEKRAQYLYYIENGLMTAEYGITSINTPEISAYKQVKELELLWMMDHGSSKIGIAERIGAKSESFTGGVDIDKVRQHISHGRNNFYVADKEIIDYYLKSKGLSSFEDAGLKVHYNCCGGEAPMYMGFSRFSPHFKEKSNESYDNTQKTSPTNFPTVIDPECVAYKLGQALHEMQISGETARIYQKHFSK